MLKYDKETAEHILISVAVLDFDPLIWHHFYSVKEQQHKTLTRTHSHSRESKSSMTKSLSERF